MSIIKSFLLSVAFTAILDAGVHAASYSHNGTHFSIVDVLNTIPNYVLAVAVLLFIYGTYIGSDTPRRSVTVKRDLGAYAPTIWETNYYAEKKASEKDKRIAFHAIVLAILLVLFGVILNKVVVCDAWYCDFPKDGNIHWNPLPLKKENLPPIVCTEDGCDR